MEGRALLRRLERPLEEIARVFAILLEILDGESDNPEGIVDYIFLEAACLTLGEFLKRHEQILEAQLERD